MKRLIVVVVALCIVNVLAICGCSGSSTNTASAASGSSSASAISTSTSITSEPVYRMVASQVENTDRKSGFQYEDGHVTASLEYGSVSEFTYKGDGLVREEKTDGKSGVATTYTETATCDDLGRIVSVDRAVMGSTKWVYTYEYYGDTFNLKSRKSESGPNTRIYNFDEDGFVTSVESIDGNTGKSKTGSFTYERVDDKDIACIYTDFDGNVKKLLLAYDDNGNIMYVVDEKDVVDCLYEKVDNPSPWVFTETNSSEAMLGYTTRALFDTEA